MTRNFWIVLILLVAGLIGLFLANGGKNETGSGGKTLTNALEVQADDHVRGEGTKNVTLIEYGDFECPGCGALHPQLQALEEEFGDEIKVVFRHFPLVTLHANAMAAHRSSEAAAAQGKFWEMHDILYERQAEWRQQSATQAQAIAIFEGYATELGLDIEQYKQDVGSGEVFDFIDAHIKSGNEEGYSSTPTLVLNGEVIPTGDIDTRLREALAENSDNAASDAAEGDASTTEQEEAPATN